MVPCLPVHKGSFLVHYGCDDGGMGMPRGIVTHYGIQTERTAQEKSSQTDRVRRVSDRAIFCSFLTLFVRYKAILAIVRSEFACYSRPGKYTENALWATATSSATDEFVSVALRSREPVDRRRTLPGRR
jgi:hypothetical protein